MSPNSPRASDNAMPMIRLVDLAKSYGTASATVHALRGVSAEVRRGERVALLGRSGSGKSTLLNVLGGLDRPSSGVVEVEGRDIARMSANELARYRLATVSIIFQSFHLIPSRTALDNVALPMVFAGRPRGLRREAARRALEAVGLGHRLHHRPAELSGGEHQRVAIARALVNEPAVLLADEPTGNLDSATAAEVIALIDAHVRRHGTTLVLVTHDEELARACTDRLLRLRDGQLIP
jgi:predicted ABC-type transport system involved in lysophospholipase L1 biosynthesis ATPase subunit